MPSTTESGQELCERADRACAAARRRTEEAKDILAIAEAYAAAVRRRMDADLGGPP
jgi:hypothetical protein